MTFLVSVIPLEEYEPNRTINGTVNYLHNTIQKRYQNIKDLKISSEITKKKQLSSLKNKISSKLKEYNKQSKQLWELNEQYRELLGKNLFSINDEKNEEEEEEEDRFISEENKVKINNLQNKIKKHTKKTKLLEDRVNGTKSIEKFAKSQQILRDGVKQNNRIRFFLKEKKKELNELDEKIQDITPSKKEQEKDMLRIVEKMKNEQVGELNSQINKTKFQLQRMKKIEERNSHSSLKERLVNCQYQLRQRDQEYNLLQKELTNTQEEMNTNYLKNDRSIMAMSEPDYRKSNQNEKKRFTKTKSQLFSEDERWKRGKLQEKIDSGSEPQFEEIPKLKNKNTNITSVRDMKKIITKKSHPKISIINRIESIANVDIEIKKSEQLNKEKEKEKEKENEKQNENENEEENEKTIENQEKLDKTFDIKTIQMLFTIPTAVEYFKEYLKSKTLAKRIYNKYVMPGSLFEVNIDYKCREQIGKSVKEKNFHSEMFINAQEIVFTHMNHNSFDPFLKSDLYKNLLKKLNNHSQYHIDTYSKKCTFVSRKSNTQVLNMDLLFQGRSKNACKVAEELMDAIIFILSAHFSLSLNQIELNLLSQSLAFSRFVLSTTELQRINLKALDDDGKKSFFINIYNVLLFHSTILNGVPQNPNLEKKFMQNYKYNIGGENYSLEDIKNGILRKNIGEKNLPYFNKGDPREKFILKNADPRIHFALNSFNSKNIIIQTIYVSQLESILKHITKTILSKEVLIEKKRILLPRLFQKYSIDFGNTLPKIINWISQFLSQRKQKKIKQFEDFSKIKFWKKSHYVSIFLLHTKSLLVKKFSDQ
ncbi:electron carrier/ protein disulfide oxidoreductase [Anaeramoeba flamelloides]|uniref:Electron carrier/ protein disulfide oxidoreductase n=1 Tax=Anaeramoeba flamelloides TaxID=1746091 RepID=A0AAV7YNE8_9EUKA|nr:electron carrier/ protein disulfide oxidoreductase [Anaeramoeba flamelloides]